MARSNKARVEVFSGPGCQHCAQAKTLLKLYGVEFEEYDVSRPEHLREFATRLPRARSIPQIFINGDHIGNDEDLRILADKGGLDDV